ncbi:MAG TPA: hypothetical protein VFF12_09705 [Myxococcaceae bacterium]|nr:hypothetical protein [Myxococcaceae bacterium]
MERDRAWGELTLQRQLIVGVARARNPVSVAVEMPRDTLALLAEMQADLVLTIEPSGS